MDGELLRGFGLTFDGVDEFTTTKAVKLSGIEISRHLKFARTASWGRWVDSLQNTTSSPKYVRISFGGIFGQNNGFNQSQVVATSSGDTTVTSADSWVQHATPNASGASANGPSALVLGTPGARGALAWNGIFSSLNPFGSSVPADGMEANLRGYVRTVTIQPGETVSLVHFVVIGRNETVAARPAGSQVAAVRAAATDLAGTPVLSDLSVGEQCTIINFTVAGLDCTGVAAPQPEHDSPTVSDEPVTTSEYDVVGKTLTQLQADMEAGKTTSQEIVRGYLDRIAAYDTGQFGLHSFIKVADDAMAQAKAADEARAAGKKGDLLGIPVAVKDLYDTKDMPMTHGSLVFEGYQPEKDAFQVAQMREAGAIVIGKTNLSEFANSGRHSESPWGQVWNAIQPSATSQGSSGGSGAAVAASMATFSMGSQTGVSLYAPSAAGGLVSLRGTDGLSSGSGVAPLTFLQDYAGPLARTVTDLAKILNVTTGTDPDDVGTVQADADSKRPADWTTYLKADALKGAKIGLVPGQFGTPSYGTQGSMDRYNAILDQLKAAGAELVDMTGSVAAPPNVPGNLGNEGWFEWIRTHPNSPYAHPNEILRSPKRLPYNRSTTANAVDMTDAQVQAARDRRTAYKANWKTYLDTNGVDAVLYPGNTSDFHDNDTAALGASFGSPPTSNIGIPGMVVPVGINDHGHPLSMQFVGRAWDDAKVLGFGYALEQLASTPIEATKLPKLRYDATATPVDVEVEPLEEPKTEAPVPAPSTNVETPPTAPTTISSAAAVKAPTLARRFTTKTKRTGVRTYTTTGTVLLPSGTTRAAACNGKVQVTIKAGKRTLSTQQVALGAKCAFSSRVTISAAKLRQASRVTVQVRFLGNAVVKPESAPSVRVRTAR
jgi:amidase